MNGYDPLLLNTGFIFRETALSSFGGVLDTSLGSALIGETPGVASDFANADCALLAAVSLGGLLLLHERHFLILHLIHNHMVRLRYYRQPRPNSPVVDRSCCITDRARRPLGRLIPKLAATPKFRQLGSEHRFRFKPLCGCG